LCLAALARQTVRPRQIILIDDGSTDKTLRYATAFCTVNGMQLVAIQRESSIGKTPTLNTTLLVLTCMRYPLIQRRIPMDIHASPASLPELDEFLATFQVRFRRPEGEAALERYLTGLLTELPNKNCDTLAEAVPGTSEQRLQEFLTNMQWAEEDLNRQRVA